MNNRFKVGAVLVVALLLVASFMFFGTASSSGQEGGASAQSAQPATLAADSTPTAPSGPLWAERCTGEEGAADRHCEVFQRLSVQKTGQRLAEFAVGYMRDEENAGQARGVIVLPLGILLTEQFEMQIDEGKKFKFRVRFCTQQGCHAFINLNDKILNSLRKGKIALISGKAHTGQPLSIKMSLEGFGEALAKI